MMKLTLMITPTSWGDVHRFDAGLSRMVPRIAEGAEISFEPEIMLEETFSLGLRVFRDTVVEALRIRPLQQDSNFHWFRGKVMRIIRRAYYRGSKPALALLADCGIPLALHGFVAARAETQFRRDDILEGIGHLYGNLSQPRFFDRHPVSGRVTKITRLEEVPFNGFKEGFVLIGVDVTRAP